jgi:hypothetical protein
MQASPTIQVPRLAELSHQDFVKSYLLPLRPVILTDALSQWRALEKWTPEFFRQQYGAVPLEVDGQKMFMAEFIDKVLASSSENPAPYLHNYLLEDYLPELLADVKPLPQYTRPNWFESRFFPSRTNFTFIELYVGGKGAQFPFLHYDGWHTHAYLMQLQGVKEYVFYAPDQTPFLYPKPGRERNKSLVNDVENPDFDKFPLFAQAQPIRCELHPGEMLFVPAGWWHTARIVQPSITVSVNSVNAANWHDFVSDYCETKTATSSRRLRNFLVRSYLMVLGLLGPVLDMLDMIDMF